MVLASGSIKSMVCAKLLTLLDAIPCFDPNLTILFNTNEFPCPNIEARSGDTLVIEVHNQLADEGLALHFHGLRMEGLLTPAPPTAAESLAVCL